MSKDTAAINDQLGRDPDLLNLLNYTYLENLGIEEGPLRASSSTLGNSWICGSTTNGIVGTNTNTQGGGQQVVGASARVNTLLRVVNPNNVFHEHFRDIIFKGTPFTANWDITRFRLSMSTSDNHMTIYNTIATFKSLFYNQQTIFSAKITGTETRWNSSDKILYELSADGGSNWKSATLNQSITFTNIGNNLLLRIIFAGNGGLSTYVEDINVEYTT